MSKKHSAQALSLAEAVLKAGGSSLKHYTMESSRDAILEAAQLHIDLAGGEDNLYEGERHWVRSAAISPEEIDNKEFTAREVSTYASILRRDAVAAGKHVSFYHIKVTAYIKEGK